jgi:hypothetical protein
MTKRFLLVGWDAADWKFLNPLLDAGELPVLNHLVETGVVGDLLGCQPLNPAALWTSLATGKRPWRHGVAHPFEFDARLQRAVPVRRTQRRCAAIWEMLAAHRRRSIVFGWPATQESDPDFVTLVSDRYADPTAPPGVKPWPPAPVGTYWPDHLRVELDALRLSPEALGPDVISRYIPQWKKIDQRRDPRIGQLRVALAFDLSRCAAITALLKRPDWDFAAVRLPALGDIARLFLPFCPPRQPWISEHEFELFKEVIRAGCRMLDHTLGAFRTMAGPETAVMVVSTHGTQKPNVPPAGFPRNSPDGWKSSHGIITAAGPGFARDALLHGAGILDVTPTILNWFGLPVGDDMEGRVLLEALSGRPRVEWTESWDKVIPPVAIARPAIPAATPVADRLSLETRWNLAQSCLEAGRFEEAAPRLQELFQAFPERADFSQALFQCQLTLGRLAEAEQTLEVFLESVPPGPIALLPRAELAAARRNFSQARSLAEPLRQADLKNPVLLRRLGLLWLRLREWEALAGLARSALQREENDPIAWLGLAEATLRQKKPAEAGAAALRAIQLKYFLPEAHFTLVRALVAQSKWKEAGAAMSTLRTLQPHNKTAAGYQRRFGLRPPAPDEGLPLQS